MQVRATRTNKCKNYHMVELPASPDVLVSQDFEENILIYLSLESTFLLSLSYSLFQTWRAFYLYIHPVFQPGEHFIFIFILFFSLESTLSLSSSCFSAWRVFYLYLHPVFQSGEHFIFIFILFFSLESTAAAERLADYSRDSPLLGRCA